MANVKVNANANVNVRSTDYQTCRELSSQDMFCWNLRRLRSLADRQTDTLRHLSLREQVTDFHRWKRVDSGQSFPSQNGCRRETGSCKMDLQNKNTDHFSVFCVKNYISAYLFSRRNLLDKVANRFNT